MKWREIKGQYIWHYSEVLKHNCVIADRNYIKTKFKISNKYYPKDKFDQYPDESMQRTLKKEFFEQKFYLKLIMHIFTS